jgi:hypothetical protein
MFAVVRAGQGILEVNYTWLPSWIGLNSKLLADIGNSVSSSVVGLPLEEAERVGHAAVVRYVVNAYPDLEGLEEYLNALKLVKVVPGAKEKRTEG